MDILKLIKTRRSVRAYQDKPIPKEDLDKILESAHLAPSAHNDQGYKFVVIKDKEKLKRIAEINRAPFVANAPLALVCVSNNLESKYHIVDISIATDHIVLAAWSLGIGTCWVGAVGAQKEVAEVISAPKGTEPIIILPMGYLADREIPKRRKEIDEIVSYEKY
jgi:nitroreductase